MPLADFYQVRLTQTLFNEPLMNVFHYRKDNAAGTATILANAFEDDLLPLINAIQVGGLFNTLIQVECLDDPTDFEEFALSDGGTVAGNMYPPDKPLNFTMRLNTKAVRPGSKRFSPFPKTWANDDGSINGAATAAVNALRLALADGFEILIPAVNFIPVVIGRVKETDPETGKVKYRLPETDEELTANGFGDVVSVLVNTKLSSQDSRGNGR